MEVILLEKVVNLGNLGDKVNIKGGYVCNFLLLQGKVIVVIVENVVVFEVCCVELEKVVVEKKVVVEVCVVQFFELVVIFGVYVGDEGKLFGLIGICDIVEVVFVVGYLLEKVEVCLFNGVLCNIGEFDVVVYLYIDVEIILKLIIVVE